MLTRWLSIGLGLVRGGYGAFGFVAPERFATSTGVPAGERLSPFARYVTRHNGVREMVVGAMVVVPSTRVVGLRTAAACDLLDVAVGAMAERDGAGRARTRGLVVSAAGMAASGLALAWRTHRGSDSGTGLGVPRPPSDQPQCARGAGGHG